MHLDVRTEGLRRRLGYAKATVFGDVWSSVWAAVDVDGNIQERIKLIGHFLCNTIVCGTFHIPSATSLGITVLLKDVA